MGRGYGSVDRGYDRVGRGCGRVSRGCDCVGRDYGRVAEVVVGNLLAYIIVVV